MVIFMEKWHEKTLGEVTSYIAKGIPPKYVEEDGADIIQVLNQKCNKNFTISYSEIRFHDNRIKKVPEDKMLRDYDVLINSTGTGTAGRIAQLWYVPKPTTIDGHMILLRPTSEIDPLYYGYAIKACQPQIESFAEGSTGQTEINRRRLQDEVIIRFPTSLDSQKKIGQVLRSMDEKIYTNKAINENLQQQAQALYIDMFISNVNSTWKIGHLSDLIMVRYGKDHKKLADGPYPVYGSGGIMRYVEKPLYDKESVLIPRKGSLNNVIYVNTPFWSVDTMFFTEMKLPNVAKFVFHFVKSKDLSSLNAGSAVPSMTTDILNAMELPVPDADTFSKFEDIVAPIYLTIQQNTQESSKLVELRDSLLPRLMSGKLDVSDIDF